MKIIITGGAGFLGSHITEEALKKKYKVVVIDKYIVHKIKNRNLLYIKSDLSNDNLLKKIIKKNDIIFHLAAISDINEASQNGTRTVNENIIKTVKLLEICKKIKIKKFIFASSIYVHCSLGGLYRITKKCSELLIEEYAKNNNFKFTILRFGSVYGPRQSIKNNISRMVYLAVKKKKLIYSGSKNSERKFIHVRDVAKIAINILSKKYDNKVVLIEGKKFIAIKQILKILKKKLKLKKLFEFQNIKHNHYIKNPYSYTEMREYKYKINKQIKIYEGIEESIKNVKN